MWHAAGARHQISKVASRPGIRVQLPLRHVLTKQSSRRPPEVQDGVGHQDGARITHHRRDAAASQRSTATTVGAPACCRASVAWAAGSSRLCILHPWFEQFASPCKIRARSVPEHPVNHGQCKQKRCRYTTRRKRVCAGQIMHGSCCTW